jgi:hypothetical protein
MMQPGKFGLCAGNICTFASEHSLCLRRLRLEADAPTTPLILISSSTTRDPISTENTG